MKLLSLGVALALCVGCSKPGGKAKRIPREGDAPPVVVVDRVPTGSAVARAPVKPEVEPNNTVDEAKVIALPGGVKGTLDGQTDVDLYAVEVKSAGWLNLELTGIDKVDLMLELLSTDEKVLALCDRGPAKMVEGIPNFRVEPGRYLVRVREFVKKQPRKRKRRRKRKGKDKQPDMREGKSPPYELRARLVTKREDDTEAEPNEAMDTAAEVTLADQVTGYMGWSKDVDMWKLSLVGISPQYSVDLDISGLPRSRLRVDLLDAKGKRVFRREGSRGKPLAIRNLSPPEGTEFYYARVTAHRPNPEVPYTLRMSTRLLETDEELEPNDSPSKATPLAATKGSFKGVRRGYLVAGDVDYYRLEPTGAGTLLSVTATPPQNVDIRMEVLTGKGATLGEANAGKAGHAESFKEIPVAAGSAILVKVFGYGSGDAPEYYELSWSTIPGTAKKAAPAPAAPSVDDSDDYADE